MTGHVLEVKGLRKEFTVESGMFGRPLKVRALDGVSFAMRPFDTLGVVGESGSGKTTLAKIIAGLIPPSSGTALFDTGVIGNFRKDVQIIFQNPYASLDPRMRVGDAVAEPLVIHRMVSGRKRLRDKAAQLLETVGIEPSALDRLPAQFSGGQRQRICIARALACEPKFLVLDEPVSSLDLTIQVKLLELFRQLKERYRLTYVFVSHNLGIIRYLADSVIVMKDGRVVEGGTVRDIFEAPREEYTRQLLGAAA